MSVIIIILAPLRIEFHACENKNPGLDTDFHDPVLTFPTVTVCPFEPYNSSTVNTTAITKLADYESVAYAPNVVLLENITRLSYDNLKEFVLFYIGHKTIINSGATNWNKESLRKWAFRVAIDVDDVFKQCKFREEVKSCNEIFHPVYTERGFCFSFNSRYYGEDE